RLAVAPSRDRGPRCGGGASIRRRSVRPRLRCSDLPRSPEAHRQLGPRGRAPDRDGPAIGKLYLVATPIGNLEDVSPRALKILQEVHMVACEDTRHTQILLRRHEIRAKHLASYTEFNHKRQVGILVGQLDRGWDVALVSDAGTPALSDPGEALVAAAIAAGHTVT